ncbi:MAG: hypothetical protein C4B59_04275 [Candidatus Methanogaster sp.]|uniref:Uncharacterized protein n=1 Tax=Candidatus Methanogaster sp. TaxID=3386292 RepID=A0AC61L512_9EURY|nr:MAG: hypothetical protein C4B59_04275 [ANME-2 cluster archaeon]
MCAGCLIGQKLSREGFITGDCGDRYGIKIAKKIVVVGGYGWDSYARWFHEHKRNPDRSVIRDNAYIGTDAMLFSYNNGVDGIRR